MKILVFDNYDSFTYNLVHLVEKILHQKVDVSPQRPDTIEKVKDYDKIILSPGPGIPEEAGLLLPLIKEYAATQINYWAFVWAIRPLDRHLADNLVNLSTVYHGVATPVQLVIPNPPTPRLRRTRRQMPNKRQESN